jgi:hypothetical protein
MLAGQTAILGGNASAKLNTVFGRMGAFCSPLLLPFLPFFSNLPPFLLFPDRAVAQPSPFFFPDLEFPPTIPEQAVSKAKASPRTEYWTLN